jgi:tetratricopeptide (TPR) repeat protein
MDPNNIMAWNEKGEIFEFLERYKEALECYEKYLKKEPKNRSFIQNKESLKRKMRDSL